MRIRKRLLSLYGSLTAPLSLDLNRDNHDHNPNHQNPPQWVQHQQVHPNMNQFIPTSSSNHTTQIGAQPDTRASSSDPSDRNKTKIFNDLEDQKKKEVIKTDFRKESDILCEEANNHDLVTRGWLEGDNMVPTKKKRGSNGKKLDNEVVQDNEMVETSLKLKDMKKNYKKEKKEGVIMEGSRCSRVNGRGWRCSQQTLVGYSLCEHHLGKGRVRNMTRVRGQKIARKDKSPSIEHHEVEHDDGVHDEENDDEEFKDWDVGSMSSMEGTFSKKTKLGVVKARSLSSLLSQISR